jgi:Cu/Ag efflux protein CusF
MLEEEIKKVTVVNGKLTIQRDPLCNLAMTAMMMLFAFKGERLLDSVKPCDKVRFVACGTCQ